MKFYTSVEQVKSKLYYRYIEDGISKKEVITNTELELFIKTNRDSDATSFYSEPLLRKQFTSLFEMSSWNKEARNNKIPVYGMTNPIFQFISNEYRGEIQFNPSLIKILNYDIETMIPDDGSFGKPEDANQPVTSITLKLFGNHQFIILGYEDDYECKENQQYIKCDSERDLLVKFVDLIAKIEPEILTGWNINSYDNVYMINRINKILGKNYSNLLSPFRNHSDDCIKAEVNRANGKTEYSILGIISLDYLDVYKQFSMGNLESYKLDFVADHVLGQRKLDYSEYKNLNDLYNNDYQKYLEYNARDVGLVEEMESKLNFFSTIFAISYDGKINYLDCFNQTRYWDTKIYNVLRERGLQIPPKLSHHSDNIEGGAVKDVQKGLHGWTCSFDLNSLYPNIMRMLNISPETIKVNSDGLHIQDFINLSYDNTFAKNNNYTVAANGSMYTREFTGLIPELLAIAGDGRVKTKNEMLAARSKAEELKKSGGSESEIKSLKELAQRLDAKQNSLKIGLNSIFGAIGCPHFRYYNPNLAEGITVTGQSIIQFIANRVNAFLNEKLKTKDLDFVILSDTDSIAINIDQLVKKVVPIEKHYDNDYCCDFVIKFGNTIINPFIASCYKEFEEFVNAHESRLVMKMENIAAHSLIVAKKNYVMETLWSEGTRYKEPKLKIMGISVARSTYSQLIKDSIIGCIKIILNGTEDQLKDYIENFKKEYFNTPIEQIAITKGITDIEKWQTGPLTWKTGTPVHVKSAICYNYLIKELKIANIHPELVSGSKSKMVYLKEPNELHNNALSFIDIFPEEFKMDNMVDYEKMFNTTALKSIKILADAVGWETEKRFTLDSFF